MIFCQNNSKFNELRNKSGSLCQPARPLWARGPSHMTVVTIGKAGPASTASHVNAMTAIFTPLIRASHRRNLRLRAVQRRSWRLKSCFRRSFLASGTKPEVAGSRKPEFDPLFHRNLPFHNFSWNY